MTFLADESGVETSIPRDGILFETPALTKRVAIGTRDVEINGATYTALPSTRGELPVALAGEDTDLIIELPITHYIPWRWNLGGIPPLYVNVTVFRKQMTSGEVETIHQGVIESIEYDTRRDVARVRVPSRLVDVHARRLPMFSVGPLCVHILYDANCQVSRNSFRVDATVQSYNGRVITVDSMSGQADDWATWGELLHVASGERVSIGSQIGTTITGQFPIPGIALGDQVQIFAGCAHDIGTCFAKFNNKNRFLGFPQLPTKNIFRRTRGFGVISQY